MTLRIVMQIIRHYDLLFLLQKADLEVLVFAPRVVDISIQGASINDVTIYLMGFPTAF